jgi:hypothetical protein
MKNQEENKTGNTTEKKMWTMPDVIIISKEIESNPSTSSSENFLAHPSVS